VSRAWHGRIRGGCCLGLVLAAAAGAQNREKAAWPPVDAEDLEFRQVPSVPSAFGAILYREILINAQDNSEFHHFRIKVLTEQGRDLANVTIGYLPGLTEVKDFQARTVAPDGTIREIRDPLLNRVIVKSRFLKVHTQTLVFPDVMPGTILEYRYRIQHKIGSAPLLDWPVQSGLFTRRARFGIRSSPGVFSLAWMGFRMPAGKRPEKMEDGTFRLELENIPPFEVEEYMPPEIEVQMRVRFFYVLGKLPEENEFWKDTATSWHEFYKAYVGSFKEVREKAASLALSSDPPETKLRKFYDYVQQLHNLSFDPPLKKKDGKPENIRENRNVRDVLKNGYGFSRQLRALFVALAQGAGMNAYFLRVATRDDSFFHPRLPDASQLDDEVVAVRLGEKESLFDPGTRLCPFGMLPWAKAGVRALRATAEGGFLDTQGPQAGEALIERRLQLDLDSDGILRGTFQVRFHGREALGRRLVALLDSEAERHRSIEEELRSLLPPQATLKLGSVAGWSDPSGPLVAEGTVEVRDATQVAGQRVILVPALFSTQRRHAFVSARRVHPIYLAYPFEESDQVILRLPEGYRVDSLVAAQRKATELGSFESTQKEEKGSVVVSQRFVLNFILLDQNQYGAVRALFDSAQAGARDPLVLLRPSRD
jgi:hypothetical protein